MTNEDRRADDLRRLHLQEHGVAGLAWRLLQPSEQERWRRAARAESPNGTTAGPAPRARPGFTGASAAQRSDIRDRGSIISGKGPCDPAHLTPRALGGCDDPLCTVPLTRLEHRAFDDGKLDLLPDLLARGCWAEIAHMIEVHHIDPVAMLNRLTGERYAPERTG